MSLHGNVDYSRLKGIVKRDTIEGSASDDYSKILDVDLTSLGASRIIGALKNTGSYWLDYEIRRVVDDYEVTERSDYLEPGDSLVFTLGLRFIWRLYVKNTFPGKNTAYKLTYVVVR